MRLLITTQVVDRTYVPLCFFIRWLEEFGKRLELTTVIAQQVGEHSLSSAKVHVYSLGKEKGFSRVRQVLRAWRLFFRLRSEYDAVLVHMTPVWVVLGFPIWFLLRKRMYLWYEARGTRWHLRFALRVVRKAFSASPGGMPLPTPKSVITGHGIDTEFFRPGDGVVRDPHLLVTVGRLTKAKRLRSIIDVLASLPADYRLRIVGVPITAADVEMVAELKEHIRTTGLQERVSFGTFQDPELRDLLRRATLFLHASNATSLDKAPLQAAAAGCLLVTASPVVRPEVPEACGAEIGEMAPAALRLLTMPLSQQEEFRRMLRQHVEQHHSLSRLIDRLVMEMSI